MLHGERTAVVVRTGYNGVEALFLILAGVLAVPATWAVRGRVLVCSLPLLFALNQLRLVGLLYVLAWPVLPAWSGVVAEIIEFLWNVVPPTASP